MAIGAALSYSVYLWHEAILDAMGRNAGVVGVLEGLVVTCVVQRWRMSLSSVRACISDGGSAGSRASRSKSPVLLAEQPR